jgi:hypothetical protein
VQLGDALRAPERDFPNEDRPWLPRGYKFEKNLAEANEVAIRLLQVRPTEWLTGWLLLRLFPSLLHAVPALRIWSDPVGDATSLWAWTINVKSGVKSDVGEGKSPTESMLRTVAKICRARAADIANPNGCPYSVSSSGAFRQFSHNPT